MSNRYWVVLAFLAFLWAPPAGHAQSLTTPIDSIVAVVEEDVILRSELDQALEGVRRQYAGRESQLPPTAVLERQVLERMTLIRLQVQRAEATGVRVTDTEVDEALGQIARQASMSFMQLQQQLERDGFTLAEFRRTMREELMVQKLRQRVIESRSDVSPSELELALSSDTARKGEVRIAVLLVATPDGASPQQIETARTKVEGIRQLIEDGTMDFAAAAIRYSDGPQALEGGDLGWRRYDQIPPVFADLVAGMRPDEVSPAIRTSSGFYLIKATDRRDTDSIVVTEFNARKIVVKATELQSMEDARQSIDAIHTRLRAGEDFAKLARELSEDESTAPLGGDLGWLAMEAMPPEFAELLSSMGDGDFSRPVRDRDGWVLVQRVASRQQDRTEQYIRNQVRDSLRQRKGEEAYEAFLRQLKGESFIEYRLAGI